MRKLYLSLMALVPLMAGAQTEITVDLSTSYQTIQGFGASDAWNCDYVGQYWGNTQKNEVAQRLFSKTFDSDGNPEGIGLSRWRFNIGAGSYEQGDNSNIEKEERRVQCFLNENGTYDWTKQKGQQWFLQQASDYGVEQLVAFVNSPPYFYTKSGRTNSDNTSYYGATNLADGYYDDFATFLATVLKHFNDQGLTFAQISPVNEPQYAWNEGQEGCPYKNSEIKEVVNQLNSAIINDGLSTKILLAEAGSYNCLYESNSNTNQILDFFDSSSDNYLGDYSQVMHGICSHSYYTDGDNSTIKSVRASVNSKAAEIDDTFEVYQTEYNLLSAYYDDYLTNALFLGKMIYADLAVANASIWDYWTAVERERWSQLNRFYLIRLIPTGGDYGDLDTGGEIELNKNLWALGNYSLFIRPGYKRISLDGADDLSGLMGSAYMSEDSSKIIEVFVNMGSSSEKITHTFENLPNGKYVKSITPYVTNESYDLGYQAEITAEDVYRVKAQSVTTLVVEIADSTTNGIYQSTHSAGIELFPNPSASLVTVHVNSSSDQSVSMHIVDMTGATVVDTEILTNQDQIINISDIPSGIYFVVTPLGTKRLIKN